MGVDRLLLAAVAPRILAVAGEGGPTSEDGATVLTVLHRAGALVVRAAASAPGSGKVVPIGQPVRSVGVA